MEETIVCKFGGTSLASADRFRRVRALVRADTRRRYIVVSAPGRRCPGDRKMTDRLLAAATAEGAQKKAELAPVHAAFEEIARELHLGDIEKELQELDEVASQGRSAAASRGEWMCARLMARFLRLPFRDAADLFFFRNGSLDEDRTFEALRSLPEEGAVIPGFYGTDDSGGIVTFPRGGSDITGAYAAAALGASLYENWTDVSGFFTADPALVPEAQPIPCLSFSQAHLFCRLGAQVLHKSCLFPAARSGVPILVKNTFAPEEPGTLITQSCASDRPFVAFCPLSNGLCRVSAANLTDALIARAKEALPPDAEAISCDRIFKIICPESQAAGFCRLLHRICVAEAC